MNQVFRPVILAVAMLVLTMTASAQFAIPTYAPKDCFATAAKAITGATDGKVVAILGVGVDVPLGTTPVNIGMNSKDGKATMWLYIVRSVEKDTVALVPLIRLLGSCSPPPVQLPTDQFDATDAPVAGLPADFTQGQALVTALATSPKFTRFRTAYPDSNASLAVIATAEAGSGGAAIADGNVFWLLSWNSQDSASVDTTGNPPNVGLTCIHNVTTGETFCFDSTDVTSVADEALAQGFAVAPNPSFEMAALTIPASWVGSHVSIDAVDMTGHVYGMGTSLRLDGIALPMNVTGLPSGMYTLVIRKPGYQIAIPMSVVH